MERYNGVYNNIKIYLWRSHVISLLRLFSLSCTTTAIYLNFIWKYKIKLKTWKMFLSDWFFCYRTRQKSTTYLVLYIWYCIILCIPLLLTLLFLCVLITRVNPFNKRPSHLHTIFDFKNHLHRCFFMAIRTFPLLSFWCHWHFRQLCYVNCGIFIFTVLG